MEFKVLGFGWGCSWTQVEKICEKKSPVSHSCTIDSQALFRATSIIWWWSTLLYLAAAAHHTMAHTLLWKCILVLLLLFPWWEENGFANGGSMRAFSASALLSHCCWRPVNSRQAEKWTFHIIKSIGHHHLVRKDVTCLKYSCIYTQPISWFHNCIKNNLLKPYFKRQGS